jgi:tetratricopeptide (TPR) repeat protein
VAVPAAEFLTMRANVVTGLVVIVSLLASAGLAHRIHTTRKEVREGRLSRYEKADPQEQRRLHKAVHAAYLPRGNALKWLSLGNRNVAAFLVQLKTFGYISDTFGEGGEKMEWLEKLFHIMLDLDPHWKSAYRMAAAMLASVNQRPKAALEVLDEAIKRWPDTWLFYGEAAATCLMTPELFDRALEYLHGAAMQPDCPPMYKEAYEELVVRGGHTDHVDVALQLVADRLQNLSPSSPLFQSRLRDLLRLASLKTARLARKAVEEHHEQTGQWPESLQEVAGRVPQDLDPYAQVGLLPGNTRQMVAEGVDAFGLRLLYDPETEKNVYSEGLLISESAGAAMTLNANLQLYRRLHEQPPESLQAFVDWVRKEVERGNENIDLLLIQTLGRDKMQLPEWPFGFDFPYNPETGRIELPPERQSARLDKIVKKRIEALREPEQQNQTPE